MNKNFRNRKRKKSDLRSQIIKRQIDKIDSLKNDISKLKIDCKEKDEIIHSIDNFRDDLIETIDTLKAKGEEYDKLISDLKEMRKIMNQEVFKGRWKIIKWLLK